MMRGHVVLVTGASRGIGAAIAKLLAAEGAAVAVNFLRAEGAAREVVEAIVRAGGKAIAVRGDVRDPDQVRTMTEQAVRKLGAIDTLVLNASISFPIQPFLEYRWDEFSAKLDGELRAAFHPCQAVIPSMIERRSGCIVAISSSLSRRSGPGFSAHSSAKSGLDALMRSLALELGPHGIRVNVVAPGLTDTDATAHQPPEMKQMIARATPLGRNGLPADVAGAVLMLASRHAAFVTGAYVPVCGGSWMP